MATLQIQGGRKEKIRAGDVLGALTKDLGFAATQIGTPVLMGKPAILADLRKQGHKV